MDKDRLVAVDWDLGGEQSYPVRLQVEARDKPGLLAALSGVVAEAGVNIAGAKVTTEGGRAVTGFDLEIKNLEQLRKLMDQLRRLKGVSRVERLRGSAGGPPQ
jgi:(p)ppGpp synthase/HD superfamily hydrolase